MSTEQVDVVIVGGGQAGLAMSYCLSEQGRAHVVLEQDRIAESWRSRRWDSLRLIAPNWSLRLPGFTYAGADPDGFMGKDEVVTHLEAYGHSFGTPIREGVRVTGVAHNPAGRGFRVQTQTEAYDASQVVLATGALQQPNIPSCAADLPPGVVQIVASTYRTACQLPPGGVLVVGSGETGCQIAEELVHDGRPVYLCFGRSWWMPRRYRGQDVAAWMRPLGWFDRTVNDLPPGVRTGQSNPQVTGGDGGHDINAHMLARQGVRLLGRLQAVRDGTVQLGDDLAANLAWGDEQARTYLRAIDAHIREQGLDAPEQQWPSDLRATADLHQESPRELNLAAAGIGTVIWATGYRPNFTWVGLPFLDAEGYPIHRRGVTGIPGLYVLGLDWLHTAKSGLFAGVGEDAAYLASIMADQPIATQPATTHATS